MFSFDTSTLFDHLRDHTSTFFDHLRDLIKGWHSMTLPYIMKQRKWDQTEGSYRTGENKDLVGRRGDPVARRAPTLFDGRFQGKGSFPVWKERRHETDRPCKSSADQARM